uniref:Fe-S metabolism associated domain-containing protein n=1 Tax=Grammatophora oceanica TaxID=210454 RepID=A0A7S1UZE5_9STRA
MRFPAIVVFLPLVAGAFVAGPPSPATQRPSLVVVRSTEVAADPLGLTTELRAITNAFKMVDDANLRNKQLLYMAGELPPISPAACVPENKVPGCLSTVYVDGTATYDEEKKANVINFVGESDGLMTKGLVALLIRGLSGETAEAINKVDPKFITEAGIAAGLTPGRNNGFLNMLAVMKKKALELDAAAKSGAEAPGGGVDLEGDRPMYNGMINALQILKPTKLILKDNSDQHAGHAGSKGYDGESHFELEVVSDTFEGLTLVQRHKVIYAVLGDIMDKIHALQIRAKTPEEVA